MGNIEPKDKNKRNCENCGAGYVINGDESKFWCEIGFNNVIKEGLCEFCKNNIKL